MAAIAKAVKVAQADARVALRRALRRWSDPKKIRIALTDAHGMGNLGDDAVFEAGRRLLADCSIESYFGVSKERRFERVGLSGARYFSHYVLGGGTNINDQGLGLARLAIQQGVPAWSLGTGAGAPGFKTADSTDLRAWREILVKFQAVGVRGPRSQARLRALGVDRVEVVGDLALALTPAAPLERASDQCFAVNVMSAPTDGSEPVIHEVNEVVGAVTRDAAARGWRPVFVAMCHEDEVAMRGVMRVAQKADLPLHTPRSAQRFFELVGPCAFMISTRLHGSVLASCAGTQPVALAYRDKVFDFMESMELTDYTLDVRNIETLRLLTTELTRTNFDRRRAIWDRARSFRSMLERYVCAQLSQSG